MPSELQPDRGECPDPSARFSGAWRAYFLPRVEFDSGGCILWKGWINKGYGRIRHHVLGQTHAHRLSWTIQVGAIPDGLCVLHRCDVRNCVNPDHLFLGTNADNIADMVAKGRNVANGAPGSRNSHARLDESVVLEVRELLAKGISQAEIARRLGVNRSTIYRIDNGLTWTHV